MIRSQYATIMDVMICPALLMKVKAISVPDIEILKRSQSWERIGEACARARHRLVDSRSREVDNDSIHRGRFNPFTSWLSSLGKTRSPRDIVCSAVKTRTIKIIPAVH